MMHHPADTRRKKITSSWRQNDVATSFLRHDIITSCARRECVWWLWSWLGKLVKVPWIFPGVPLTFNGTPENIQGNLTGMTRNQVGDKSLSKPDHWQIFLCIIAKSVVEIIFLGEVYSQGLNHFHVISCLVNTTFPRTVIAKQHGLA